jgi:hypothetical protein
MIHIVSYSKKMTLAVYSVCYLGRILTNDRLRMGFQRLNVIDTLSSLSNLDKEKGDLKKKY